MRTTKDIANKIIDTRDKDILGFTAEVLAPYLSAEEMIDTIKKTGGDLKGFDSKKWKQSSLDRDSVLSEMADYMKFAWGKVQGHRGISASRSVEKMQAWVWVLGDDDFLKELDATEYAQYGAPVLAKVCKKYGFPIPDDDGLLNMINGVPCSPSCDMGCGQ